MSHRSLHVIASVIREDWDKPYFGAVPYLNALGSLDQVDEMFGLDSASSIVAYFLSNAQTWKGEVARAIKVELKAIIKA